MPGLLGSKSCPNWMTLVISGLALGFGIATIVLAVKEGKKSEPITAETVFSQRTFNAFDEAH
jgi:hypothetical protein